MKTAMMLVVALLLVTTTPAFAHRVDELLQATTISLENGRVDAEIRLTPGIEVVPAVVRSIDTNADGVISAAEQGAYGESVLRDVSLTVDGARARLLLVSWAFPDIALMKAGRGQILLEFTANVSKSSGRRTLRFENRHQKRIAEYLVNALVPRDSSIRITAQRRNYEQSSYQMDFVQAGVGSGSTPLRPSSARWEWIGVATLLVFVAIGASERRRRATIEGLHE